MRNLSTFWICLALTFVAACTPPVPQLRELAGTTMGTTYSIRYAARGVAFANDQEAVDSLLAAINRSLSTYIPSSLISQLNASTAVDTPFPIDDHFLRVFLKSQEVYRDTKGAFNPAVGPLVEAWGFGAGKRQHMSPEHVDSLRALVDFETFRLTPDSMHIVKGIPGARLDFSAIAKGYGVDAVARLLAEHGATSYFVEIGGEVAVHGRHPAGREWRVGIDRPIEDATRRELQAVVDLADGGMATSGNYRNFYVENGQKYAHTIDPATGYPALSALLSATIAAEDCMTADAYATAAMVMGAERAPAFVLERSFLEGYFIIAGSAGEYREVATPGFERWIEREGR